MIELSVPGRGSLRLQHLVTDVNGTLAKDGALIEGLAKRIAAIQDRLVVHLLTAGDEQEQKRIFVEELGAEHVVAIGQGANDAAMLKAAGLGICVMSDEGAAI